MNLRNFALLSIALVAISCGQTTSQTESAPKTGAETLSPVLNGEESLDLNKFTWINGPSSYEIGTNAVCFKTSQKTDLWQHTLNGADLSNAPMLVASTNETNFTFTVKTEFDEASTEYDQCGPIIYLDRDNWLKASVEKSNGEGLLGSVNNANGKSDWATSAIPEEIKTVWYQVSRMGCDFVVSSSFDGIKYNILRFTHVEGAEGNIQIGVYACSPGDGASFNAKFSEMSFKKGAKMP